VPIYLAKDQRGRERQQRQDEAAVPEAAWQNRRDTEFGLRFEFTILRYHYLQIACSITLFPDRDTAERERERERERRIGG
jgi:hypothetical protein